MSEIPISLPTAKRPDVKEKIIHNQVSPIEMKIGEAIIDILGLPIVRQLMIYNPWSPIHPFEIDIYVPSKDLALDINGRSHKTQKIKDRQVRKDRAVKGLTGITEYHHIDVSQPRELIYYDLHGEEREKVKHLNDSYYNGKIYEALKIVSQAKTRPRVQTPRILKSEEHYNNGQEQLKKLLNINK